jgi:hypothetical protein
MADKKISALETIVTVDTGTDLFPIVDSSAGVTKKITPTALKTALSLDNVNNTSDLNKPISTATQDALDNRVIENAPITPGTAPKITYDAKGLVTSGDSLDETDLPTGINANKIGTGVVSSTEFGYLDGVTSAIQTQLNAKQATLVSGTNIKTINSTSLLGSGDITISANPSGVAGAIQFSNGSAFASDASNLFWDDTNNRLGVGTATPTSLLNLSGSSESTPSGTTGGILNIIGSATNALIMGSLSTSPFGLYIQGGGSGIYPLLLNPNGSNVGIATTDPTAKLHIKGSGSTSATTSLLVQNSSGVSSLQVNDKGSVFNFGKGSISSNTVFGNDALQANTTGSQNTAMGLEVLYSNTTGLSNSSYGLQSMFFNTTGGNNTAIGVSALINNTTGSSNSALGVDTESGNFSGSVILGRGATATANNQFVVGSSGYNAGAIDSSAFTQDKRWKVKINGVDYYIALQTA